MHPIEAAGIRIGFNNPGEVHKKEFHTARMTVYFYLKDS